MLQAIEPSAGSEAIFSLPLAEIYGNPNQPRKLFDADKLWELAKNIEKNGLLQAITVVYRPTEDGKRYMIVAGERRYRACCLIGLEFVPAVVKVLSDQQIQELALIENIQRVDMTLLEEARAYQELLDGGMSIEELAEKLGFNQPWRITERTNLLRLDAKFQDALDKGVITPSQATEMTKLSIEGQYRLWRAIQNGQCNSYNQLTRMRAAIEVAENQTSMFAEEISLSEPERRSLSKVDRFLDEAGRLITSITDDDLSVLESVLKSNAPACIQQLNHVMAVAKRVRDALEFNLAKQQASAA